VSIIISVTSTDIILGNCAFALVDQFSKLYSSCADKYNCNVSVILGCDAASLDNSFPDDARQHSGLILKDLKMAKKNCYSVTCYVLAEKISHIHAYLQRTCQVRQIVNKYKYVVA